MFLQCGWNAVVRTTQDGCDFNWFGMLFVVLLSSELLNGYCNLEMQAANRQQVLDWANGSTWVFSIVFSRIVANSKHESIIFFLRLKICVIYAEKN